MPKIKSTLEERVAVAIMDMTMENRTPLEIAKTVIAMIKESK